MISKLCRRTKKKLAIMLVAAVLTSLGACTPTVGEVDPTSTPPHTPIPATPEPTQEIVIEDGILTRIDNLLELNLKDMKYYHEGKVAAQNQKGKWGFANEQGHWVIDAIYDEVGEFGEGMAAVGLDIDGHRRYGYVDEKGEVVLEPQYCFADRFSNGLACVIDEKEGCHCYITTEWEVVLRSIDYGEDYFFDGYFDEDGTVSIMMVGEKDGDIIEEHKTIDREGNVIDEHDSDICIRATADNGYSIAVDCNKEKGHNVGVIDGEGHWVIEPIYYIMDLLEDDKLLVTWLAPRMGSGVMSLDGEWIWEPNNMVATHHRYGMFAYKRTDTSRECKKLYDVEGNPLLNDEEYASINIVAENLVVADNVEYCSGDRLYLSDGTPLMEEYKVRVYGTRPLRDSLVMVNTVEGDKEQRGIIDMSNPTEWLVEPKYELIILLEEGRMLGTVVTDRTDDELTFYYEALDGEGSVLKKSNEITLDCRAYCSIILHQ